MVFRGSYMFVKKKARRLHMLLYKRLNLSPKVRGNLCMRRILDAVSSSRALETWEREYGPDHPKLAAFLNNQATLRLAQGMQALSFRGRDLFVHETEIDAWLPRAVMFIRPFFVPFLPFWMMNSK